MIDPCRKCILTATCKVECPRKDDYHTQWSYFKAFVFFSGWIYFAYVLAEAFVEPI